MQFGWAPGMPPAPDALAYISSFDNARPHGGPFEYRSILTDVLGLVLEQATGTPLAELLGRSRGGRWAPSPTPR